MSELEQLIDQAIRRILTERDAPIRITPALLAERYRITPRLAAKWLCAMKHAGIVAKFGDKVRMARLSACDAWVASGGADTRKTRRKGVAP